MKILIADDQPLDRSVLKLSLEKWGYAVLEAEDGEEALRLLEDDEAPSLAILDWMMPGLSGPQVCERIRAQARQRYTYILLLTSKDDKEDIVQGMDSGADDYIVKPVNMQELQVRLRAGRRIIDLEKELIETREELRIQATRDFLTNVWNRGTIMEKLDEEINRAMRSGTPLGVLMCDIDHFKEINDTYGHPAGDVVLAEVAHRMHSAVRTYDYVGRFGGEEFLIICPGVDEDNLRNLGERLRMAVAETPVKTDRALIDVTISLGTALHDFRQDVTRDQLLSNADGALYTAKHNGRNRVESSAELAQS